MIPKLPGVYLITNVISKKVYVGSSKNLKWRWSNHKSYFKKGNHHNNKMQNAWNKYGEKSFSFSILEICDDIEKMAQLEQKWIDFFGSAERDNGYNILPIAFRQYRTLGDCIICKREKIKRTKGRCHSCNEYLRKFGKERPYIVNGKSEKQKHKESMICLKCKRPLNIKGSGVKGLCLSCYRNRNKSSTQHEWVENNCGRCGLLRTRKQIKNNNKWAATVVYFVDELWIKERPPCVEKSGIDLKHHMANARETHRKKKGLQNLFP